MYKGKRDPEVPIVVRREWCNVWESPQHERFIEIFVPRTEDSPYPWGTILVKPAQVYYLDTKNPGMDDLFNVVMVNNYARISVQTRDRETHNVIDAQSMTPDLIIGSILKEELKTKKHPQFAMMDPAQVFLEFKNSGLTMESFLLRGGVLD